MTNRYRAFTAKMDWPHAVVACQMWGGNLVTINSAEENGFVVSLLKNASEPDKAWIGLNSYEIFVWDEDLSDSSTLVPSQNKSYPLHCVYISMLAVSQGNWFSQECWSSYTFVCEKPFKFYGEQGLTTTTTEAALTTTCSPFGASATCPANLNQYGVLMPDRGWCYWVAWAMVQSYFRGPLPACSVNRFLTEI